MAHDANDANDRPTRAGRPGWLWLVGALVLGLLVGGVVVAVFSDPGGVAPPSASGTASPTGAPSSASATVEPGSTQVLVSPACLGALNEAQDAYAALLGAGKAARNLDAAALDRIVQQAQVLQQQLQRDIGDCRATVRLPDGSSSPVPLSSASPTVGASAPASATPAG